MRWSAFAALVILALWSAAANAVPLGHVSQSSIDFGYVAVGQTADESFVIHNEGDAVLTGSVVSSCAAFVVTAGGGAYSLDPGDSVSVTVRFAPTVDGTFGCTLYTSSCRCSDVLLSGEASGAVPAVCSVSPTSLDLGTVESGQSSTKSFVIKNTGGSILSGTVSESCSNFALSAGSGPYSLEGGDSVVVSVKFTAPASEGSYNCSVSTGGAVNKGVATCSDVTCTASVANPVPICTINPTTLAFGTLAPDSAVDRSFVIKNTGFGTLTGIVDEACADFSITAGSGAFSLGAAESVVVTVRLQSSTSGNKTCTVTTGTNCSSVSCGGFVSAPPGTDLASTDFTYDGAFKFGAGGTALGFGAGRGLGIKPNGDLVILGTDLTGWVAVCTPATPIITTDPGAMNQATTVATYADPTGGRWQTDGVNSRWEDIAVLDDRIAFTAFSYYDRAYDARGGLGFMNLSFGSPSGMFYPGPTDSVSGSIGTTQATRHTWYPGKVCGQMQQIPAAYVEGGRTLAMGRSRDEYGEDIAAGGSLYFVDPDDLTNAVCALCYDQIGVVGTNNPGPHSRPDYSLTDRVTDMAWIGDTVILTESKCQYASHYYQAGQSGELGDPGACGENTGYTCGHAGDSLPGYRAQFQFYHVSDLMAVAHGEMDQWAPQPYDVLEVTDVLLSGDCNNSIAGAAWDETNRYLYVIETRAIGDTQPVCHRWTVATP